MKGSGWVGCGGPCLPVDAEGAVALFLEQAELCELSQPAGGIAVDEQRLVVSSGITVASMFRVKGAWLAGLRFIHSFFTRLSTGRLPSIASGHHALAACL